MDKPAIEKKPPDKEIINDDEGQNSDPLENINICGVLLEGSNSQLSRAHDQKPYLKEMDSDIPVGSLLESVETVLAEKLGDKSITEGVQDGKSSFHVKMVVDDDEEEEEEELLHQRPNSGRSNSMAIPSVPIMSRNVSIASSPPIGKRAFAAVAPTGQTTSSLAAQIQHSLAALDDISHAESYTAAWLGNIQTSEHKPKIISTPGATRQSPPRHLHPIVPILPSSPSRLNQASESLVLAADSKHRHEAIMRIHASEASANREKLQDCRQPEQRTEMKPITLDAVAPTQKDKGNENTKTVDRQKTKSTKEFSSQDGSKNGTSKKEATGIDSAKGVVSYADSSVSDADSKKKTYIPRKYSSTKSCQTTDGSENWHETEVAECSSATRVSHKHLAKLGVFMLNLYEHDRLTDVIVKVGSCTFSAHAIMLSCYSPVLAKIIKEGIKTKIWDHRIEIQDNVTPAAFQILLDYMYKGEIDVGCENLAEVLCAAMELRIESVRKVCEGKLDMLDASAALRVLETAHANNIRDQVKESMMKVICQGFQQVCESPELQQLCVHCLCDVLIQDQLLVLSEYDVAMAALHWLDKDTEQRSAHLSQVIACVRLGHLTMDELFRLTDRAPYVMEDKTLRARLLEANWHQASLQLQRPGPSPSMSQLHPRNAHVPASNSTIASSSSSTMADQKSEIRIRREWLVNEARAIQAKAESVSSDGGESEPKPQPKYNGIQKSSSSESADSKGSKTSIKVFEMKYGGSVPRYNSLGTLSTSIANEAKSMSGRQHMMNNDNSSEQTLVVAGSMDTHLQASPPTKMTGSSASTAMTKTGDGQQDARVERSSSRPVAIPGTSAAHIRGTPDDPLSPRSAESKSQGGGGGQFLVMVGGYKIQGESSTPVRSIHCYSNKEKMWQTLSSSLPEPRAHHSIVYLDCFIYVIGGCNPTSGANTAESALDTVFRVSTMDESGWTEMTPLTKPRMYHHSVVLDGDIYTLGGEDHMSILDTVERYIPTVNRWQKRASMLSARLGCAATLWKETILVVGGIGGKYVAPLDTVEQYDASDDSWTYLVPLRTPRVYPGLHVAGGELFLVGGLQDISNELIPTAEMDRLVEQRDKTKKERYRWEKVASMITPRYDMACVADGDHLLILGGVSAFNRALSTVERYDVVNQNWIPEQPSLPQALAGPRCFVANFDSKDTTSD